MTHMIDDTNGKASCFTAGEAAWHRLGVNVADAQKSEDAIKLANLDWTVSKEPCFAELDGTRIEIPDRFAVVRSDTKAALGVVGNFYEPFQNAACFEFIDGIIGDSGADFETAGAIDGGKRVWMMARLPREICVAGDDVVNPYVLITNSHDGTSSARVIPTTVRVVCNNTLNLALRQNDRKGEGLKLWHSESLQSKLAAAKKSLGVVLTRVEKFELESQALAKRSMSQNDLAKYFVGLCADKAEKTQQKMMETFLENLSNERNSMKGIEGSAWAAYNAASEFADHQMKVNGTTDDERLNRRLNSVWFGAAAEFKQKAWKAAMALVS